MNPNSDIVHKNVSDHESVVFKGYKSGLALIIPDKGPMETYLQELKTHLEQSQEFFKGAKVFLKIGNRILKEEDQAELLKIMEQSGLQLHVTQENKVLESQSDEKLDTCDETDPFRATITVKKTVRSGQRVVFEGNLVVMGDVNPGAELVATGDIIVLGKLRGTAHAGAQGDTTAQIIAFQLQPVQIRIAGVITRAPDHGPVSNSQGPEVARIKDGLIIVEKCNN